MNKRIVIASIGAATLLFAAMSGSFAGGTPTKDAKDTVKRNHATKAIKPKKQKTVTIGGEIQYTITSQGKGPKINAGDKVTVFYVGKLTNDTVFDASSKHGYQPFSFVTGRGQVIPGWDSVMKYLHAGDKVTMRIPPAMGYGARNMGAIPPNSTLIFDVEVLDVKPKPTPWDAKGKDTITTPSGLKLVMFESHPENAKPTNGQTVKVHYSGYLTDGKMFDSSVERGSPFEFPLGQGRVIKGWDEGIALLRKGEKAKLILPYQLAYGEQGRPPMIPQKATLIFDVQLVDFK
jgi:peptidylprolyl isomerase